MAKVTEISLENFRVFKDKQTIKLAPITILTGKNNSGKSSFVKAVQLISRNIAANKLPNLDFNLSGEKHNLGNFENILNNTNKGNFEFIFKIEGYDTVSFSEVFPEGVLWDWKDTKRELIIKFIFTKNGDNGKLTNVIVFEIDHEKKTKRKILEKYSEKPYINLFWFYIEAHKSIDQGFLEEGKEYSYITKVLDFFPKLLGEDLLMQKLKKFNDEKVKKFLKTFNERLFNTLSEQANPIYSNDFIIFEGNGHDYLKDIDENKIEDLFLEIENEEFEDILNVCGKIEISEIVTNYNISGIYYFLKEFEEIITSNIYNIVNFEHLEAQKSNAQRIYLRQSQESIINELIEQIRNLDIKKENLKVRFDFLNFWMGKSGFDLGDNMKFEWHTFGNEIKLTKNGRITDLVDLGYGTNQTLSLLIKILISLDQNNKYYDRQPLMLEEPEINLHPNLQSKLADMFIDAHNKFEITFIIETHSEYLIRKLQYLTAKKEIKPEDTSIYYFTNPEDLKEGEEQVKEIRIKENGVLTQDFGPGFLDEANKLAIELFLLSDSQKN